MPLTKSPAPGKPASRPASPIELIGLPPAARRFSPGGNSATETDFTFAEPARSTAAPVPLKSMILILLCGVALYLLSARDDFLLGQLAAPFLTLGALHGVLRGGFRKIIMLAATVGILYGAAAAYDAINAFIQSRTGSPSPSGSGFGVGLAAVVAIIVVGLITKSFRRRVILKHRLLRGPDRFLGMLIGLAEGALVILTVCWTVVAVRPYATVLRDQREVDVGSFRHGMAVHMVRLADEANTGEIGRFVAATNMIEQVPALRQMVNELNTKGEFSLDSLGDLDPETARKLNDLLKQTPVEDLGGLDQVIEQYRQGNESRDRAYRQLPGATPGGR